MCIGFYGYKPISIQTDNGGEFTSDHLWNRNEDTKEHDFAKYLREAKIKHKRIPSRTPRWQGRVERTHSNDERWLFAYAKSKYVTVEKFNEKLEFYIHRYNRRTTRTIQDKDGNWKSPLWKYKMLVQKLYFDLYLYGIQVGQPFHELELQEAIYKWDEIRKGRLLPPPSKD